MIPCWCTRPQQQMSKHHPKHSETQAKEKKLPECNLAHIRSLQTNENIKQNPQVTN